MGKSKKRSEPKKEEQPNLSAVTNDVSDEVKKKKKNKKKLNEAVSNDLPTVSIALPGSIIYNARSLELATRLILLLLRNLELHAWNESLRRMGKPRLRGPPQGRD